MIPSVKTGLIEEMRIMDIKWTAEIFGDQNLVSSIFVVDLLEKNRNLSMETPSEDCYFVAGFIRQEVNYFHVFYDLCTLLSLEVGISHKPKMEYVKI